MMIQEVQVKHLCSWRMKKETQGRKEAHPVRQITLVKQPLIDTFNLSFYHSPKFTTTSPRQLSLYLRDDIFPGIVTSLATLLWENSRLWGAASPGFILSPSRFTDSALYSSVFVVCFLRSTLTGVSPLSRPVLSLREKETKGVWS